MSRATPMAPETRRRALIEATLPLLLSQGPEVSTREIAAAAGVAEGTIFRAFETKQELIHATIHAALQPDAALAELAGLPEQPLTERVAAIFDVVRAELQRTRTLFAHLFGPGSGRPDAAADGSPSGAAAQDPRPGRAPAEDLPASSAEGGPLGSHDGRPVGHRPPWPGFGPHDAKARLATSITTALEPYAGELVVPPPFAAQALLALSFATSFSLTEDNPLNRSEELAQIVLHGLARGER